jgi:heptosyltransferase III
MATDSTHLHPGPVKKILVWHQGALGDLLLAGPALVALSRHYPEAAFVGVGHPDRWRLLAGTLPLGEVRDGGEALWSALFQDSGDLPPGLTARLAGTDLAVVFSPRPRPGFLARLVQGGASQAVWIPSFPEGGVEPVAALQAWRLGELGIRNASGVSFRLRLEPMDDEELGVNPGERILTMAPGSGQPAKNWPLSHDYEVARGLSWEAGLKVVWLAGPAEEAILPYIQGLAAAQEQIVWAHQPLARVARLLARTRVFLGGDSGLSHLAAAAGARRVVALFGPTDPRVWAPVGEQVTVLTPPPGGGGTASLADLPVAAVLAAVRGFL